MLENTDNSEYKHFSRSEKQSCQKIFQFLSFLRIGLVFNTTHTPFSFDGFTVNFLGTLLINLRRQVSSTFEVSVRGIVSSRTLSSKLPVMPIISRHSLLEYCLLLQHLRSKVLMYFVRLSVIVLVIRSSHSRVLNLVFS